MARLSCIETLEQRRLLSISMVGHQLNVRGAARSPNTITVGLNPGGASIYAEVSYPTRRTTYHLSKTFPLSRGIRIINISWGKCF